MRATIATCVLVAVAMATNGVAAHGPRAYRLVSAGAAQGISSDTAQLFALADEPAFTDTLRGGLGVDIVAGAAPTPRLPRLLGPSGPPLLLPPSGAPLLLEPSGPRLRYFTPSGPPSLLLRLDVELVPIPAPAAAR